MPIGYEYDPTAELVHTRVGSQLSLLEFVDHLRSLHDDDRIGGNAIELISLKAIRDFSVRAADIHGIETELRTHIVESGLIGAIFVGGGPLQVGVANMLSGLVATLFPDYPMLVVRNMEEALEKVDVIRGCVGNAEVQA